MKHAALAIAAAALTAVCIWFAVPLKKSQSKEGLAPLALPDGWRVADAAALQGARKFLVETGFKKISQIPQSHSALIVHRGEIVAEQYFHGYEAGSPNAIKSMSKGFLSVLAGVAFERKILAGLDVKLTELFPREMAAVQFPDAAGLTLENLLNMTTGFDTEDERHFFEWTQTPYWPLALLTAYPLKHKPGAKFMYSTGNTHLFGLALARQAGLSLRALMERHVLDPLGIELQLWETDPQNNVLGGGGMWMRPRDAAKLGQLMLNKGRWHGRQLVSADWVARATQSQVKLDYDYANGFGYLWWIQNKDGLNYYFTWGYGGQYVYVVPEKDLVIAVSQDFFYDWPQKNLTAIVVENFMAAF